MNSRNILLPLIAGLFLTALAIATPPAAAQDASLPTADPAGRPVAAPDDRSENKKILVEIYLSPERKGEVDAIKKEFQALSITKVRPQVFRKGNPPQNIGFGREIPADVAREAIRLATTYNNGIQYFLPEKRLAPNYIGIGVSIFDEAFQIPVGPDDLKRLTDPTLTTAQFHEIYHKLTDQPPRINRDFLTDKPAAQ